MIFFSFLVAIVSREHYNAIGPESQEESAKGEESCNCGFNGGGVFRLYARRAPVGELSRE
jgi:hypothetical protein